MSKRSNRKRKRRQKKKTHTQRQRAQPKTQSTSLGKIISKGILSGWRGLVGVSVLFSILSSLFFLPPRLSIEPGATVEKLNPFYTPFILANQGYFDLLDMEFTCGLGSVVLRDNQVPSISNIGFQIGGTEVPLLGPGKSTSIPFNRIFNKDMHIESADITVAVSYRYSWFPYVFTDTQAFKTRLNYSGELLWVPNHGRTK